MPRPAGRGGKRLATRGSTDLVKWGYGNPACQPLCLQHPLSSGVGAQVPQVGAARSGAGSCTGIVSGDSAHHGFEIEELGVDKDHGHVFLSFPPKYSIGQVVGLLKAVSAREIRAGFPEVRKQLWGGEFWEDGYFARTGRRLIQAGPVQEESLSPQEEPVLALVAEGLTNKEIAATLQLSNKTVKNYLASMFPKSHISRRAQAAPSSPRVKSDSLPDFRARHA